MSVVGLAASQTFINKMGKTLTGIKIEFSKNVTITRHDSAFPEQSPKGRAQEFTFSGKDLRNLGRFSVSWLPSSGKVTDYEWIETAQPAQATQVSSPSSEQEVKLPDPNAPAILYGNDYPGPDDPLYQPNADEQIWLTDLDGHEDIYDNDSIKINYAPGFDKSLITKIDVYRNGIRLRFLPETFDVLTNVQMKTFDGNPAEKSPASNHTDHAIMGYEYKFEIHTVDHVWMFAKTVKSGFKWRPKEAWAQIPSNFMSEGLRNSSYDNIVTSFKILKQDGFTGVSVTMNYYVETPTSNEVKSLFHIDNSITPWGSITLSEADLNTVLSAITEAGLDAHVRGQIYISKEYQKEHGFAWSSMIEPRDSRAFFDSYTGLWLELAPILNKYHVKLVTPFTEMDGIERDTDLIREMYTKLDGVLDGELGFEEATNLMLQGASPVEDDWKTFEQVAPSFTFWNWEDSQGRPMRIEYSCWTPPLETQNDQRASVMTQNFVKFLLPAVDYYSSEYPSNVQMYGEIGSYVSDGSCLGSSYWNQPQHAFDEQEMADIWYAYLKGSTGLGLESINIWQFSVGDYLNNGIPEQGNLSIGYRQPENPAYRVIKAIIGDK